MHLLSTELETDHTGKSSRGSGPPNAKRIGGVWFPKGEKDLIQVMADTEAKDFFEVFGKITYQYRKQNFALSLCRTFDLMIDVGAHVGLWSMHLGMNFKRVEAFEPVGIFHPLYQANVNHAHATLHGVALGDRQGILPIHFHEQKTGNTRFGPVEGEGWEKIGVQVCTLDEFNLAPSFVKIDCEGYEKEVLLGGEKTFRAHKPSIVIEQKVNQDAVPILKNWGAIQVGEWGGDLFYTWE